MMNVPSFIRDGKRDSQDSHVSGGCVVHQRMPLLCGSQHGTRQYEQYERTNQCKGLRHLHLFFFRSSWQARR